jgi:hypothetical protein
VLGRLAPQVGLLDAFFVTCHGKLKLIALIGQLWSGPVAQQKESKCPHRSFFLAWRNGCGTCPTLTGIMLRSL